MANASRRRVFSDFPDARSAESALVAALPKHRTALLRWEYALMRAETAGLRRPSSWDLFRLHGDMTSVRPLWVWVIGVEYGLALLWFTAVPLVLIPGLGVGRALLALAVPDAVILTSLVLRVRWLRGPRARAMRLIWASRDADSSARRVLLEEALHLELGQA